MGFMYVIWNTMRAANNGGYSGKRRKAKAFSSKTARLKAHRENRYGDDDRRAK